MYAQVSWWVCRIVRYQWFRQRGKVSPPYDSWRECPLGVCRRACPPGHLSPVTNMCESGIHLNQIRATPECSPWPWSAPPVSLAPWTWAPDQTPGERTRPPAPPRAPWTPGRCCGPPPGGSSPWSWMTRAPGSPGSWWWRWRCRCPAPAITPLEEAQGNQGLWTLGISFLFHVSMPKNTYCKNSFKFCVNIYFSFVRRSF